MSFRRVKFEFVRHIGVYLAILQGLIEYINAIKCPEIVNILRYVISKVLFIVHLLP